MQVDHIANWLGRIPGRLLHVNVLGCGIFGSVSGSSAATCATIAKIALPELKKRGYPDMISLGSPAGAGTLGILIPPSITMVIYAVAANVSILKVFLAGFLPGLVVMALYSGYIAVWALLNPSKMPPPEPKTTLGEKLKEKVDKGYQALDVLEKGLTGREFLVGNQYSLADISLYAYTHVAEEGNFSLARFPAIRILQELVPKRTSSGRRSAICRASSCTRCSAAA